MGPLAFVAFLILIAFVTSTQAIYAQSNDFAQDMAHGSGVKITALCKGCCTGAEQQTSRFHSPKNVLWQLEWNAHCCCKLPA